MNSIQLSSALEDVNYVFAKYNFVLQHFPDCKIQKIFYGYITRNPVFLSKSVNNIYNKLSFKDNGTTLAVIPYCELDFTHNGKTEKIIINSSPKRSLLARVITKADNKPTISSGYPGTFYQKNKAGKRILKFARLAINLKNHNFDDKMMNECRVAIVDFIRKNSDCELDDKYLEPKLKQLLSFL